MKHLTILVPDGQHNISSIAGTYKVFTRANDYLESIGGKAVFKVQLAGLSEEVDYHNGIFMIRPHVHINEVSHTDLIIIPSVHHDFTKAIQQNAAIIQWVAQQYKQGATVASICTGAFLLASTGLLKGRECATHWRAANKFKQMFPDVNLVADKVVTEDGGIFTNGGAFSFLNLVLHLVERYYGRETAIYCSKIFEIDIDRTCQSTFTIFAGQKEHQDEEIKHAQQYIEEHVTERITVEDLAAMCATGRRNFDRRFRKATGHTPSEYVQRVKMEAVKKQLETTRKTISELMYEIGYADTKAFRTVFKKVTGLSPLEYRNKYNKEKWVADGQMMM